MTNISEPDAGRPAQRKLSGPWVSALLFAVIISAGIQIVSQHSKKHDLAIEHAGVGQPLPLLELEPLTGVTEGVSLKDVRGKVALINYWGTWCPPCIMEFPHMVELWDKNRGNSNFVFLSVSSTFADQEDVAAVREATEKFLLSKGTTLPTYIDAQGASRQILATIADMKGFAYPTTVLLDRNGIIRAIWVGYESGMESEIEREISTELGKNDK